MIKEIIIRFLAEETPLFWKKIRSIAVVLVTASSIVIGLSEQLMIDERIVTVATYLITIGATLGIAAQTTKK